MRYRRTGHRSKLLAPNVTSLIQPMDQGNTNTEGEVAEILDTLKHLSISDECNETDIDMWLACDNEHAGFQILNDDEIVATVSNLLDGSDEKEEEGEKKSSVILRKETGSRYEAFHLQEFCDDEMLENVCPSHEKAFQCLEAALQWFEMQEE
ncbi:hypothetical protein M514_13414 [Trichuris suis]|uniref:Uncharacterized protein n=1 Tax=Trichuris suis TaxID=68888 RepID=A0A085MSE8_9BILA|nr:hypothetical protein M513_13414 [Trichuris suis]KFD60144.1 hypothetical protein M514_13414 [Trichuris suis]